MAIYKLNSNKKKKEKNPNVKKIVGFSLIGAASVLFLLLTGIIKPLQTFFLGLFGVFAWPLCIILLIVGLALVNNRKYVMSKRYTICLILSVVFLLCILQLAVVGDKSGSFWNYLALNYSKTWTPAGFFVGILTTIFLYITNIYGAYIIFSLALILCVALLIDSLNILKKNKVQQDPVSVQIKDKKREKEVLQQRQIEQEALAQSQQVEAEPINVMLGGNMKEEKKEDRPLTAREILGLDKKRNDAYEYHQNPNAPEKKVEKSAPVAQPKTLREMILTPPEINIDEYFKDVRKPKTVNAEEVAPTNEISQNINTLKTNEISPTQTYREDEFKPDNKPIIRKSLPEVEAQTLVDEADDILRSAIEEEKKENPEIFEKAVQIDPEKNLLERIPDRDNGGNFAQRENGGRMAFERKFTDRAPANRFMTQEDKDARAEFSRNEDKFNARNGMLSREQAPIAPEEEKPEKEPYVYERPPFDLITTKSVDLSTLNEDVATKRVMRVMLENTLETFGVPAKVAGVVVAPAVTRYELEMPQGVAVSKIKNRKDDIALSLAAEGSIRIEAPVPGKSVVGVEVPNDTIATVSLKDILMSKEFLTAKSPLTFALGKDIAGQTICCDMQKLTHLLVAGSTGSGKSVCLNSIILSIIYKASPEDVRLLLIDPKRVEFANYENLPHMIIPKAINDTQKAINALTWAVDEMERRFDILGNARVKDIDEFNQTPEVQSGKIEKLPFIVIIVDEVADLMMTGGKDGVEEKICRLAQKARAAGIHLILATQRPSTDVITGLIKTNFPSRISFALTSAVDSMTILSKVGAEDLLGKGDMLYFPNGAKEPVRVQGCYVGTREINNIVDYAIENNLPIFDKQVEENIYNPNKNSNGGSDDAGYNTEMDSLLPKALKISIDCGQASASMLRRKFAIGYPRAMRIIDQMEEAGYISAADGPKGRTVFITEEQFKEIYGDDV